MAHVSKSSTSSFSEYARHLIELHSLAARGLNDSDDADGVRDLMDEPWARLTTIEEVRARGLSTDLYKVGVDRPVPDSVSTDHAGKLVQLRDAQDWDALLEFLRENEADLPPADVARLRGICWGQLGEPDVAVVFFREAERIAPDEAINEILELNALTAAGRTDEAIERAKTILMPGTQQSAIRLLGASSVLFHAADTPNGADDDLLQSSVDAAERGLKLAREARQEETLLWMRQTTYVRLALSYFWKNDQQKARAACQESLRLAPNDPETLILLAWIERDDNPASAEEHFRNGFLRELKRRAANPSSAEFEKSRNFGMPIDLTSPGLTAQTP